VVKKKLITLNENFKKLVQNTSKITVKTNGVEVKNEVTHNFFIRLQKTQQLNALYKQVKQLDESSQYLFDKPHLSLSYGIPIEKINPYAANYVTPRNISFDQISLRPLKNGSEVLETINMTDKNQPLLEKD
jgi:hypothetical protein